MDRDVYVIELLPKGDVPEVDHLLQQETLRTGEILLCAPRLVAHVDHNLSPEGEENEERMIIRKIQEEMRQLTCYLVRADEQGSGLSPFPWPGSPACCSALAHDSEQEVDATFTFHLVSTWSGIAGRRRVVAASSRASRPCFTLARLLHCLL